MKFSLRPQNLLLVFVILFVILSVTSRNGSSFTTNEGSVDLHFGDTYYVVATRHLYLGAALWLSASWIILLLLQRLPGSAILLWSYAIISILSVLILTGILGNYNFNNTDLENLKRSSFSFQLSVLLLAIAQAIAVVNASIGIFRMFTKNRIAR